MAQNRRLYYGCLAVAFCKIGSNTFTKAFAVEGASMTTSFNLDYVFELGQVEVYQILEGVPDITIELTKAMDGTPPLYCLATNGATSPSLAGRGSTGTIFGMATFSEQQDAASGNPLREVTCSGAFHSSFGFQFNIEGAFKETMTLVGNNKVWATGSFKLANLFNGQDSPPNIATSGGVQQRQNMVFSFPTGVTYTLDTNGQVETKLATILPPDIEGISSSGTNNTDTAGFFTAYLQSINVTVDLQRENLLQLGRKIPYFRYPRFPVECRTEIEAYVSQWDNVSATEAGTDGLGNNLTNRTIVLRTQDGLVVNMGKKNILENVAMQGGGVDGSLLTARYSYVTQSFCTVTHPQDPSGLTQ